MDKYNQTLKTYEENADKYASKTGFDLSEDFLIWIRTFVKKLPKNPTILEIGSGHGAGILALEDLGAKVIGTDISQSFIDYNKTQGRMLLKFDVINDKLDRVDFDGVFANAVFVHFTTDQFNKALMNLRTNGAMGKIFAFSLKQGEGEYTESEKLGGTRYFKLWTKSEISTFLKNQNVQILNIFTDSRSSNSANIWMCLIVKL